MADRELTLPSYGARFRDIARRSGLADFWQWWRGELVALVPAAPRTAIARRRMRPVLVFAGDRATLWRARWKRAARHAAGARDPLADDADGSAAIASLATPAGAARRLSLNPQDCLRKRLTLPAALEENLARRSPTTSTATRRSSRRALLRRRGDRAQSVARHHRGRPRGARAHASIPR
jgi:hypothetical protein